MGAGSFRAGPALGSRILRRRPGWSLLPQPQITAGEQEAGLKRLEAEAAWSSATTAVTSGVVLAALALHLGASNLAIGALAAAPFLAQLLQLPAILLVEAWRTRKWLAVTSSIIGRSMLLLMGVAPLLPVLGLAPAGEEGQRLGLWLLILAQSLFCIMGSIGGCAWNAWLRDVAPPERLGMIFARRTMWASAIGLGFSLAAGLALDLAPPGSLSRSLLFLALYAAGTVMGLTSAAIVARIPEPLMPPRQAAERPGLMRLLAVPLGDRNFRRMLRFLGFWQFAVNLAAPFFTVWLLQERGLPMSLVTLLTVLSLLANLATLRIWGLTQDRFAGISVLSVAAPVWLLGTAGFVVASQIQAPVTLLAVLILLHLVMGAAIGGITLATTTVALKLSPAGSATAYVACNAVVSSGAAGLAPLIGGAVADWLGPGRLVLSLNWRDPAAGTLEGPALILSAFDLQCLASALLGLFALRLLAGVREQGQVDRAEILEHLRHQTRRTVRNLSTIAGLRAGTEIPGDPLRKPEVSG